MVVTVEQVDSPEEVVAVEVLELLVAQLTLETAVLVANLEFE
jgi:hypothetical protein